MGMTAESVLNIPAISHVWDWPLGALWVLVQFGEESKIFRFWLTLSRDPAPALLFASLWYGLPPVLLWCCNAPSAHLLELLVLCCDPEFLPFSAFHRSSHNK